MLLKAQRCLETRPMPPEHHPGLSEHRDPGTQQGKQKSQGFQISSEEQKAKNRSQGLGCGLRKVERAQLEHPVLQKLTSCWRDN